MPQRLRTHFKGLRRANPSLAAIERGRFDHGQPIAKIDTRPMVFVFALLVPFFMVTDSHLPVHAVMVEVWDGQSVHPLIAGSEDRALEDVVVAGKVTLTDWGEIKWDEEQVSASQLVNLLQEVQLSGSDHIVELEPEANASYELSAKVLEVFRRSGTPFRITGMEQHCEFDSRSFRYAHERALDGSPAVAVWWAENDPDILEYTQSFGPCDPQSSSNASD